MFTPFLLDEKFTSVQEAQAGLTKLLVKAQSEGFYYRLLRNNKPLGILLPNVVWEDLLEDLEALSSQKYLEKIAKARRSKRSYTAKEVKKTLGTAS